MLKSLYCDKFFINFCYNKISSNNDNDNIRSNDFKNIINMIHVNIINYKKLR